MMYALYIKNQIRVFNDILSKFLYVILFTGDIIDWRYFVWRYIAGVAILVPGVQVAKAQALELTVVVPRETTSGR